MTGARATEAIAAVEQLAARAVRAEELLAQVAAGVVASSPVDGLTTVRVSGDVMSEIRALVAP